MGVNKFLSLLELLSLVEKEEQHLKPMQYLDEIWNILKHNTYFSKKENLNTITSPSVVQSDV